MASLYTEVIETVSREFKIHKRDITGPTKFGFILPARYAVYKLLRLRGSSYCDIGRWLGKDHSTIMHGCRRADYMLEKDEWFRRKIDNVMFELGMKETL